MAGAAGAVALVPVGGGPPLAAAAATATDQPGRLADKVIAAFKRLPGQKALKLSSPGGHGTPEWSATLNSTLPLFCASAFKAYVLTEFLRQVETGAISLTEQLALSDAVFSPDAPSLNPPHLTGTVTAQTVLDAMILHSDNTATDMALKRAGADRVRQFIASIGLRQTRIPTSTRQMIGYIGGFPDWRNITWAEVVDLLANDPYPNRPAINPDSTMVSTPDDFVSFYSRALQGEFFTRPETLHTFRATLGLAGAIPLIMPLGVNAFMKGGSADFHDFHVISIAGGMFVPPDRWVYFGMIINWTDADGGPVDEVQGPFVATTNHIFTLIRNHFARGW
jgi:beta-lactamase class A